MSYTNGPVVSSQSMSGLPISGNQGYYFQCDGNTIQLSSQRTITHSTDTGYIGDICFDEDYLYYCYDVDTWARVALDKNSW